VNPKLNSFRELALFCEEMLNGMEIASGSEGGFLDAISLPLRRPGMTSEGVFMTEIGEDAEELLPVSRVILELNNSPPNDPSPELEVVAQSGKTLTLALSASQASLIDALELGIRFPRTQFFSPYAVFRASCLVSNVPSARNDPEIETHLVEVTVETG